MKIILPAKFAQKQTLNNPLFLSLLQIVQLLYLSKSIAMSVAPFPLLLGPTNISYSSSVAIHVSSLFTS